MKTSKRLPPGLLALTLLTTMTILLSCDPVVSSYYPKNMSLIVRGSDFGRCLLPYTGSLTGTATVQVLGYNGNGGISSKFGSPYTINLNLSQSNSEKVINNVQVPDSGDFGYQLLITLDCNDCAGAYQSCSPTPSGRVFYEAIRIFRSNSPSQDVVDPVYRSVACCN